MCAIILKPWIKVFHWEKRKRGQPCPPSTSLRSRLHTRAKWIPGSAWQKCNLPPQLELPLLSYQELCSVWDISLLQTNKLVWYQFMDTSRSIETPGSEEMVFVIYGKSSSRVLMFSQVPHAPWAPRARCKCLHGQRVALLERNTEVGDF